MHNCLFVWRLRALCVADDQHLTVFFFIDVLVYVPMYIRPTVVCWPVLCVIISAVLFSHAIGSYVLLTCTMTSLIRGSGLDGSFSMQYGPLGHSWPADTHPFPRPTPSLSEPIGWQCKLNSPSPEKPCKRCYVLPAAIWFSVRSILMSAPLLSKIDGSPESSLKAWQTPTTW